MSTQNEIAESERKFAQLKSVANGLGIDQAELERITAEVNAEAQASLTWGTIDDRVSEIRRRMFAAAEVGTSSKPSIR